MKLKEVLQKITDNLEVEKDLKVQIKTEENNISVLADKIKKSEIKLEHSKLKLQEMEKEELEDLKSKATSIKGNLRFNIAMNDHGDIVTGFEYKFMDNSYILFNDQYLLNTGRHVLQIPEIIEEIYKKYSDEGCELLNKASIDKIKAIKSLYDKNPVKVAAGFENLKAKSVVKNFENKLIELRAVFDNNVKELEKLEEKIQKAKVFKSPFMQKMFDKRAKLEEKQNELYNKTEEIGMSIKALEMELADRTQIDNDVKIYVSKQMDSLSVILDLIKGFEVVKYRLSSFKNKNIYFAKQEIEDMEKDKLKSENNLEDLKSMLKLNRKVNKETISMAFKDKEFGVELDNAALQIPKEHQKAYDLLQAKYDRIIAAKIKKII